MPSSTYKLFEQAIRQRKQIVCLYRGYRRELCPIILGHKKSGEEAALTFQFAGESSSRPASRRPVAMPVLSDVSNAELRDGPWHSGVQSRANRNPASTSSTSTSTRRVRTSRSGVEACQNLCGFACTTHSAFYSPAFIRVLPLTA